MMQTLQSHSYLFGGMHRLSRNCTNSTLPTPTPCPANGVNILTNSSNKAAWRAMYHQPIQESFIQLAKRSALAPRPSASADGASLQNRWRCSS